MSDQRFSIAEAYGFGFRMIAEYFFFFIRLMLTIFVVTSLVAGVIFGVASLPFLSGVMEAANTAGAQEAARIFAENITNNLEGFGMTFFLAMALFSFWGSFIKLGYTKILLELYDRNSSTISTLFTCSHLVLRNIVAMILYGLMCLVGFVFFVIPGIYFLLTYGFYLQFIVDKQVGVFEAFSKSAEITQGVKWKILGTFLLIFPILFIVPFFSGVLSVLFGNIPWLNILVSILSSIISMFGGILFALVYVYMYRKLSSIPST